MRIVLASASPRRAELLTAAGIPFDVHAAHIDEAVLPGEAPDRYVVRLAEAKAAAVAGIFPARVVLSADTTVVIDGLILGKPTNAADATSMLRRLSGQTHEVLTGVCVAGQHGTRSALARTFVRMAELSEADVEWYVSTGEPMDKAGAYGIQGLASRFVTSIDGSYSNVVGLPVALVVEILKEIGAILTLSPQRESPFFRA